MNYTKDVASHGVAIVCAFFGIQAAVPAALGVLAAIGYQKVRDDQPECRRAVASVLKGMERSGEIPEAIFKEVAEILTQSDQTVELAADRLPDPSKPATLNEAFVKALMSLVPPKASADATAVIRTVLQHAVASCRYAPSIHVRVSQELLWAIRGDTLDLKRTLIELHESYVANNKELATTLAVFEGELIGAMRAYYRERPADREGIINNVVAAMQALQEAEAKGNLASNTDERVRQILDEVRRLRREDRNADALATLQAERKRRAEERKREAQETIRLCEETITSARLENAPLIAADAAAEAATLDAPEGHGFQELRRVQEEFYVRGHDQGVPFDLQVSVGIADIAADRAMDQQQRATALNDKAVSLLTLGERGNDDALRRAVEAFEDALTIHTREAMPAQWAKTRNNLGAALFTLGQRGNEGALRRAVEAYEDALTVRTREAMPVDWAATRDNLGTALFTLGQRGDDNALRRAIEAYEDALTIRSREAMPAQWATTSNNLGNALLTLGQRGDDEALHCAVEAYEDALTVNTREAMPVAWAMTRNNLGVALLTLGQRGDDDALRRAVEAYEDALTVHTREAMPVDWAMTRSNLGNALFILGERGDDDALRRAVDAYEDALTIRTRKAMPADWAMTQENLALCFLALRDHAAALDAVGHALTIYTPENMPFYFDKATRLRDRIIEETPTAD